MKAVGYKESLPIENSSALLDIEIPVPCPENRDLLVEIRAISVNPVDVKVRMRVQPVKEEYKILGWDAAGPGGWQIRPSTESELGGHLDLWLQVAAADPHGG